MKAQGVGRSRWELFAGHLLVNGQGTGIEFWCVIAIRCTGSKLNNHDAILHPLGDSGFSHGPSNLLMRRG